MTEKTNSAEKLDTSDRLDTTVSGILYARQGLAKVETTIATAVNNLTRQSAAQNNDFVHNPNFMKRLELLKHKHEMLITALDSCDRMLGNEINLTSEPPLKKVKM